MRFPGMREQSVSELKDLIERSHVQPDYLDPVYQDHRTIVHRPRTYTKEESSNQSELQVGDMQMFWQIISGLLAGL